LGSVPKGTAKKSTSANLGLEAQTWAAADALSGSVDSTARKHVVLGAILFAHISDAFEEELARLVAEKGDGAQHIAHHRARGRACDARATRAFGLA